MFEFSFPKIGFMGMLFLGIVFPSMCFLERLVNGLNSRKYFIHFQKYPWQRAVAIGGGLAAMGNGLAAIGYGLTMVWRQRVTVEDNRWWVAVGDNRGNLIFSLKKILIL